MSFPSLLNLNSFVDQPPQQPVPHHPVEVPEDEEATSTSEIGAKKLTEGEVTPEETGTAAREEGTATSASSSSNYFSATTSPSSSSSATVASVSTPNSSPPHNSGVENVRMDRRPEGAPHIDTSSALPDDTQGMLSARSPPCSGGASSVAVASHAASSPSMAEGDSKAVSVNNDMDVSEEQTPAGFPPIGTFSADVGPTTSTPTTRLSPSAEEDEGIDLGDSRTPSESGDSGVDFDGVSDKQLAAYLKEGPYIYDLFSIMVHSGSANGGHYYAYIKNLDNGQWYCFNDQSVSGAAKDELKRTYGGSTGWGPAYSPTNAYMLMYRQIDKSRNARFLAHDGLHPHLISALERFETEEEEARKREEYEHSLARVRLFCHIPNEEGIRSELMNIPKSMTLHDILPLAYETMHLKDHNVALQCCRLVKYDSHANTFDYSWSESELNQALEKAMGVSWKFEFFLEIKPPHLRFEKYNGTDGCTLKVVNIGLNPGGPTAYFQLVVNTKMEVVLHLRERIANYLEAKVEDVRMVAVDYQKELRVLDVDDRMLSAEFVHRSGELYVECSGKEKNATQFIDTRFFEIIDRLQNLYTLTVTLPDKESYGNIFQNFFVVESDSASSKQLAQMDCSTGRTTPASTECSSDATLTGMDAPGSDAPQNGSSPVDLNMPLPPVLGGPGSIPGSGGSGGGEDTLDVYCDRTSEFLVHEGAKAGGLGLLQGSNKDGQDSAAAGGGVDFLDPNPDSDLLEDPDRCLTPGPDDSPMLTAPNTPRSRSLSANSLANRSRSPNVSPGASSDEAMEMSAVEGGSPDGDVLHSHEKQSYATSITAAWVEESAVQSTLTLSSSGLVQEPEDPERGGPDSVFLAPTSAQVSVLFYVSTYATSITAA